jgi:hypothetical protein
VLDSFLPNPRRYFASLQKTGSSWISLHIQVRKFVSLEVRESRNSTLVLWSRKE